MEQLKFLDMYTTTRIKKVKVKNMVERVRCVDCDKCYPDVNVSLSFRCFARSNKGRSLSNDIYQSKQQCEEHYKNLDRHDIKCADCVFLKKEDTRYFCHRYVGTWTEVASDKVFDVKFCPAFRATDWRERTPKNKPIKQEVIEIASAKYNF